MNDKSKSISTPRPPTGKQVSSHSPVASQVSSSRGQAQGKLLRQLATYGNIQKNGGAGPTLQIRATT